MFNKIILLSHSVLADYDPEYLDINRTLIDYLSDLGYRDRIGVFLVELHAFTVPGKIDLDEHLLRASVIQNSKLLGSPASNEEIIEEHLDLIVEVIYRLNDEMFSSHIEQTEIILPIHCPYVMLTEN